MAITDAQAERIAAALAGAFDRHDLAGMAHADAGITETLRDDDSAVTYAARLVRLAERMGRLDRLVLAALRLRPENYALGELVAEAMADVFEKKMLMAQPTKASVV